MIPDQPPPYGTIVFDCDSTLSSIEGIDELASAEPEAVAELTRLAMEGVVPLDEVYGKRLEMIQPTQAALERVSARYIEELVPGIREVFEVLHAANKHLVIVSGGLLPAVAAVGAELGVSSEDIHAVGITFDANGDYVGFESESPLARSGGKLDVLKGIAETPGAGQVALVGDGVTDLEALPVISRFLAWGGVIHRDEVHERSACSCDGPDARQMLRYLLSDSELADYSPDDYKV